MNDRLSTLLTAIAALLLATFLLMPPTPDSEQVVSLPTSEDAGSDGLKGLYKWLQGNNIPVYSLRKRFTALAKTQLLASKGNLLIISMPQHQQALKSEWQALSAWLNKGNSLIVLGAAYSRPNWAEDSSCFCDIKKLLDRHGWKLEMTEGELESEPEEKEENQVDDDITLAKTIELFQEGVEQFTPLESTLNPVPNITILDSVTSVQGKIMPALVDDHWQLRAKNHGVALRLLALANDPTITAFWQIDNNANSIYLSLLPDLFANKMLDKANNADLIGNIIIRNLARGGRVIFDDYHFGLSDLYDAERFFSDPRLHKTIAFIGLLWLLYVVGYTNRLAPVHATKEVPSTVDFVEAMAGFFTHRIDQRTLAQELVTHLIQDVRRQRHYSDEQQAWDWLQNHTQLQATQLVQLQRGYRRQRTALDKLTNTITKIRTTLLL